MPAPSSTVWGNTITGSGSAYQGKIGIYIKTSITATLVTVSVEVWFWSKYSVLDKNNSYYYNSNATTATSLIGSRTINHAVASGEGWSTSNQTKLGSAMYNYPRNKSAYDKRFAAKFTGIDILGASNAMTATSSVSIPALVSYSVKYNANGGTGAPDEQKKWYGEDLTLQTGKPTKPGHNFKGWATSKGGSVEYAPGAKYTANAAVTLYAVWKAETYAVKYNANGGTGEPTNQTKTYGQALPLSTVKPTFAGYNFKGWATSKGGSVEYAPGAKYTANAAITLYAVWSSSYSKPKISSVSVYRSNASGTALASGKYARVEFKWSTSNNVSSITIAWNSASSGSGSTTVTASGKSGEIDTIIGGGNLSTDASYSVTITVADSGGNWSAIRQLPSLKFTIDCLAGGNGVAFGKVAELSGYADFGFKARFRDDAVFNNLKCIYGIDPSGNVKEAFCAQNSNGNTVVGYDNYDKKSGNTNIYGYDVYIGVSNVGSPTIYRPYFKKGDTINITLRTAGYITGSAQNLNFWVPLAKPVIGNPTVTVASGDGFVIRQGSSYTHGSGASSFVSPNSYSASYTHEAGILVTATFSNVTNATNNDTVGVYWDGTITFS